MQRPAPDRSPAHRAPARAGLAGDAAGGLLIGVGVDAERIGRFEKLAAGGTAWRHVYSSREAEHLAAQPQSALAFCAAFCAKEALCKALGSAYPFRECECLHLPGLAELELSLSPGLKERHGLGRARVRFHAAYPPERGECVVEAHLFGAHAARDEGPDASPDAAAAGANVRSCLETIAIAAVESARARVGEEHFRAAELADLGSRRVQSLAGSLALKRALCALWAEIVGGAPCSAPRDFELGHLGSGAPLLVAAPPGIAPARVRVSIAHTREWAYGLAAVDGAPAAILGPPGRDGGRES